jgi:hypothetical protein
MAALRVGKGRLISEQRRKGFGENTARHSLFCFPWSSERSAAAAVERAQPDRPMLQLPSHRRRNRRLQPGPPATQHVQLRIRISLIIFGFFLPPPQTIHSFGERGRWSTDFSNRLCGNRRQCACAVCKLQTRDLIQGEKSSCGLATWDPTCQKRVLPDSDPPPRAPLRLRWQCARHHR